jgi:subtilase family serine protease
VVGGTSASTPAMAGIMALVEQKNGKFQGLANFNFYKLAAKDTLNSCNSTQLTDPGTPDNCFFRDVTSGNNTVPDVNGFPARVGYDLSTGLGTVKAARLVNGWNTSAKLASRTTLAPGAVSMQHGQPFPIQVFLQRRARVLRRAIST